MASVGPLRRLLAAGYWIVATEHFNAGFAMMLDFNPAADLNNIVDGGETVTYRRRGSPPGSPGTTIVGALRRKVHVDEPTVANRHSVRRPHDTDGRVTQSDVVWHLPTDALSDAPRVGDVIVDSDDGHWTVIALQSIVLGGRWRCLTRNIAIVHDLDDTIDILAASYSKGDGGALEADWQTWRVGVRARIQPTGNIVGVEHQARRTARRVLVFLADDLALDHTYRIRAADGSVFRIISTTGTERIGELQTVEAERIATST